MMNNMMEYKGYHTKIEFDAESMTLRGKIEGINDYVDFEAGDISSIEVEFHSAVDDYLEFCKEVGKDPEKEYAMDFFLDSEAIAYKLFEVLAKLDKRIFITEKRNKKLVYLRNSEDIMDLLVLTGAVQSFFSYEEVTMMKDMKNKKLNE